jgi:hypothetical protein
MAIKVIYKPNYTKIYDNIYKNGLPAVGASVALISRKTGLNVGATTIDGKGYFEFVFQKGSIPAGVYDVKFYGCGLLEDYKPEGDWETLEIRDPNVSIAVSLHATPGAAVKFQSGLYIPDEVALTVNTYNIYLPEYKWYKDLVLISGETSDILTVDPAVDLASANSASYKCEITGKNLDGEAIEARFVTTNLVKYVDGESGIDGPGIAYRGIYSSAKTYVSTNILKDVVNYDGYYYICNHDGATGVWNPAYWDTFGANFESVATGLLLAEDAIITKTLTLGEVGNSNFGTILSANVTDIDTGSGFYLSANNTSALFRVGDDNQFIKWNGTALRIKSTYFDLTTEGKLWSNSGGFGGTVESPKIELNTNGLKIGETYIHGENAWTAPTSVTLTNSNVGTNWGHFGTVTKAANLLTITYTNTTTGPNVFSSPIDFSAGWDSSSGSGTAVSGSTAYNGAYFRNTGVYLEAGTYLISFDITVTSLSGTFEWKVSTSSSMGSSSNVGTPINVASSGNYTGTVIIPSSGTYYFGGKVYRAGYPFTANVTFSATNISLKLDGVEGPEANSYVYFTEALTNGSVNKIYEFKGFFEGIGEVSKKHTYRIDILIDDVVVKTVDGYKYDGITPTPFSVSYMNTTTSGTLKVKITYTGVIDQATTLPALTE